ncbi:MAG: glycosidase, partial [Ignavibacteria bacterium]|nr:glycosidase [Ignavibacteria bacterium]
QLGREPEESEIPHLKEFYEKLLDITSEDVIKMGEWSLQEAVASWPTNETYKNILAWKWEFDKKKILVVINYSNVYSACRSVLDIEVYPEEFNVEDLLNNQIYQQNGEDVSHHGLYVDLKPWNAHIFRY